MTRWWRSALVAAITVATTLGPALAAPAPAYAQTIRDQQWWLSALRIDEAHALTRGAGIVVAVVDSGVGQHPDLDGQVLPGISYADGEAEREDLAALGNGHGTGMAGIIAGKGTGPQSLLGIAPDARILPVHIDLDYDQAAAGIRWAVDHKAAIVNCSFAGGAVPVLIDAVQYAVDHDVVVVAGAGNLEVGQTGGLVGAPARIRGVVAVGAVGPDGQLWPQSITGPQVVLTAPGVNMVTARPADRLGFQPAGYNTGHAGTSEATAVVSGAAALIRAKYPDLTAGDVIKRLIDTADEAGLPGRDPQYGFGRLNLIKALTATVPRVGTKNPLGQPKEKPAGEDSAATGDSSPGRSSTLPWLLPAMAGVITVVSVTTAILLAVILRRRRRTNRPPG